MIRRPAFKLPGKRLAASNDGVTAIEFAIVAPVLLLMLVGFFDIGHTVYMTAALQGAVQKAARDAALQNNATTTAATLIDANVTAQVMALNGSMANPTISRRYYRDYNAAAAHQYEPYNDINADGRCDNAEPYTDTNWNSVWDQDGADSGQGSAQDRTIYTVTVLYPRLFPLDKFINVSHNIKLVASTILANQPYADQAKYPPNPLTRNCA